MSTFGFLIPAALALVSTIVLLLTRRGGGGLSHGVMLVVGIVAAVQVIAQLDPALSAVRDMSPTIFPRFRLF